MTFARVQRLGFRTSRVTCATRSSYAVPTSPPASAGPRPSRLPSSPATASCGVTCSTHTAASWTKQPHSPRSCQRCVRYIYSRSLTYTLSLRFNGHFPDGPGLAGPLRAWSPATTFHGVWDSAGPACPDCYQSAQLRHQWTTNMEQSATRS